MREFRASAPLSNFAEDGKRVFSLGAAPEKQGTTEIYKYLTMNIITNCFILTIYQSNVIKQKYCSSKNI